MAQVPCLGGGTARRGRVRRLPGGHADAGVPPAAILVLRTPAARTYILTPYAYFICIWHMHIAYAYAVCMWHMHMAYACAICTYRIHSVCTCVHAFPCVRRRRPTLGLDFATEQPPVQDLEGSILGCIIMTCVQMFESQPFRN